MPRPAEILGYVIEFHLAPGLALKHWFCYVDLLGFYKWFLGFVFGNWEKVANLMMNNIYQFPSRSAVNKIEKPEKTQG